MTADELIGRVLNEHLPVYERCVIHGLHSRGCTCGQDPLDFVEHLVNKLIAAGVCTYTDAAERVDEERAAEIERLRTQARPDPHIEPMLGNYLGGLSAAATTLRRCAPGGG